MESANKFEGLTTSSASIVSILPSKISIRSACSSSFLDFFFPFECGRVDLRCSITARYSSRVEATALNEAPSLHGLVDT